MDAVFPMESAMAELTPDERDRIYLEEKARHDARAQIKAEEGKEKPSKGTILAVIVLGLCIAIALFFFIRSANETLENRTPHRPGIQP